MTRTPSIATSTAYTDILAQNYESYMQLKRQHHTILSSARPTRRRREVAAISPSFTSRFKTRYVPLSRRLVVHNVSPRSHLGRHALYKALSAPEPRLQSRRCVQGNRYEFRYKTLRARKRAAELLPRPRASASALGTVSEGPVDVAVPGSMGGRVESEISRTLSMCSPEPSVGDVGCSEAVALCIADLSCTPAEVSPEKTSRILSFAEYWLDVSKTELKKLKEPLKKQTAALENVAYRMARPSSSGYRKVRGYMQRDTHRPHFPHVFARGFRHGVQDAVPDAVPRGGSDSGAAGLDGSDAGVSMGASSQDAAAVRAASASISGSVPDSDSSTAPAAPPASGVSSAQLCLLQKVRNSRNSGSACTGDCMVCRFLERAYMQRQLDSESDFYVETAPGRMLVDFAIPTREQGVMLIQHVLDRLSDSASPHHHVSRTGELRSDSSKSADLRDFCVSPGSAHANTALAGALTALLVALQALPRAATLPKAVTTPVLGPDSPAPVLSASLSPICAAETSSEAIFINQLVPSTFRQDYLVLSPISSFDGSFREKPVENDCGFLDLGPSRLLKQVRFIVDDEFNARDSRVTWSPSSRYATLGSLRNSGLQGYLMELGGSEETLVLQSAGISPDSADHDDFAEFSYQVLATGAVFASTDSLDSGYYTAQSS